jgi:hypothetical protein
VSAFTPRLPGFVVVQADQPRRASYASLPLGPTVGLAGVSPQFTWWPGACIPNCVCVQDEGCPCCGYGSNRKFPEFPFGSKW